MYISRVIVSNTPPSFVVTIVDQKLQRCIGSERTTHCVCIGLVQLLDSRRCYGAQGVQQWFFLLHFPRVEAGVCVVGGGVVVRLAVVHQIGCADDQLQLCVGRGQVFGKRVCLCQRRRVVHAVSGVGEVGV